MRTVIGVLSFILLTFPNPIELTKPHKEDAIHPSPIQLHIHHLVNSRGGIWYVGKDKEMGQEYIIGVIIAGHLSPITNPRADIHSNYGSVKVRIDGHIANVTVPITKEDPLNNLFYKKFRKQNILPVEIRG